MREVELTDPDFVSAVLRLFDLGRSIGDIAFLMETDYETIDRIICDSLAKDMVEDVMKDLDSKC